MNAAAGPPAACLDASLHEHNVNGHITTHRVGGFSYSRNSKEKFMLILTRKIGETVRIGDQIAVTVLAVHGNQVRLGVSAPRSISVHREEIYDRLAAERGTTAADQG